MFTQNIFVYFIFCYLFLCASETEIKAGKYGKQFTKCIKKKNVLKVCRENEFTKILRVLSFCSKILFLLFSVSQCYSFQLPKKV